MPRNWLWIAALAVMTGCGPAISTGLQQQAGAPVSFAELAAHPDQYRTRLVVLGGEVKALRPLNGGSLLVVSYKDLDRDLRPVEGKPSLDTFMVESARWLPPDDYIPTRKVTMAGVVKGRQGDSPLVEAREIHLWEHPTLTNERCPPMPNYRAAPPYYEPLIPGGRR